MPLRHRVPEQYSQTRADVDRAIAAGELLNETGDLHRLVRPPGHLASARTVGGPQGQHPPVILTQRQGARFSFHTRDRSIARPGSQSETSGSRRPGTRPGCTEPNVDHRLPRARSTRYDVVRATIRCPPPRRGLPGEPTTARARCRGAWSPGDTSVIGWDPKPPPCTTSAPWRVEPVPADLWATGAAPLQWCDAVGFAK